VPELHLFHLFPLRQQHFFFSLELPIFSLFGRWLGDEKPTTIV
jgi:hypothetical protein